MIRPARLDDAAAVRELLVALGYEHDAGATLARLLDDPAHVVLVAEEDGRIVSPICCAHWLKR